jgi:hypothetical protein
MARAPDRPTMLGFTRERRTLLSQVLGQLANIGLATTVIGQLVRPESRSLLLVAAGIGTWWVLVVTAVVFAGGRAPDDDD